MPVNEIHAPVYVKGRISTPAYPDGHRFHLYFATGSAYTPGLEGDAENWRLTFDGADVGSLSAIVFETVSRNRMYYPAGSHIKEIELWHSIPNADNVLDHINPLPPADPIFTGAPTAAAYTMFVMQTALRAKFRWTCWDGPNPAPQKYPFPTMPEGDDSSFGWWMLKGDVPFANNDGIRLTTGVSLNQGYNRALARSYGRTTTP